MLRCYANLINLITIKKPNKNGQFNTTKLGIREYSTSTINNQIKYNQLGAYLAGLIEGDGNIYTPGLNVKGYPQIEIAFDIKDIQLAKKIISVIGVVNYLLELMVKAVK